MIEELLQEITRVEASEEARVNESVAEAKSIVENARLKSLDIKAETETEVDRLHADNIKKANARADKLCAAIEKKTAESISDISAYADSQSADVIADIIGRIEKKYA